MSWFEYLLQVNIYLTLLYGLYSILLRNETFFRLNRIYLLVSGILSFLIPVLQIDWIRSLFITEQVRETTKAIRIIIYQTTPDIVIYAKPDNSWNIITWLFIIYFTGLLFYTSRFLWQLYTLYCNYARNLSQSQAHSFFKKIIVSDNLEGRNTILEHEKVHTLQWHSADILFFEFIAIINWFNPVVYACKKTIRYIHEFIADEIAAGTQASKEDYSLLLVSNMFGVDSHKLSNSFFSQSLIKRRILMLHKSKSRKTALLKYGFSIPLFFSMLIFSSATIIRGDLRNYVREIQKAGFSLKKIITSERQSGTDGAEADPYKILPANYVYNHETIKPDPAIESFGDNTFSNVPDDIIADNLSKETASKVSSPVDITMVQVLPKFSGGEEGWMQFMQNYQYPSAATKAQVSGEVVVQFVIEADGSVTELKILHDLGYGTGAEAVRLLKSSPKWIPGIRNGRPVRIRYVQRISLAFSSKDNNSPTRLREIPEDFQVKSITAKSSGNFFLINGTKTTESELQNISQNLIQRVTVKTLPKEESENHQNSHVKRVLDFITRPLARTTINAYMDKESEFKDISHP